MSAPTVDHLLTTPCELVRRVYDEAPDADGAQPFVETVETTSCELQPVGSLEDATGSVQTTSYRVFLPAGVPLRGWDAIRLTDRDELLELDGDAFSLRSPLTGVSYVEAVAQRTDYGTATP